MAETRPFRLLAEAIAQLRHGDAALPREHQAAALVMLADATALLSAGAQQPARRGGLAPWQMQRLTRYIDSHLQDALAIAMLAEIARLSPAHFCRAFKVSFGRTPHGYVLHRRLECAQRLMLTTDAPLAQIAVDCGLFDQAHLSRVFRRSTGTTPNAWRRQHRRPAATVKAIASLSKNQAAMQAA
ncbi:helix-turn-helix domain-containing protein [Falsiroseomonas sp.]|uniref:helix-turn-helix domain-containing protein n=1 Tax=Falsiroseomonas sp. TaxID=2870721 RepID=UPI003F70755E